MLKGQVLELGHTVDLVDDPNSKGDRIEHMTCNRKAGLEAGQAHSRFKHSRKW
jgi:hypothetical protein